MKEGNGKGNPFRAEIEKFIEKGDTRKLLEKAGELHGHLCNFLTYRVKTGYTAVKELGVRSIGMEEIIAIVETNNCFSDGVQMTTGCTFGNNALTYRALGKTAVTAAKRNGTAIRIALKPDFDRLSAEVPSIPIFIIDCARSRGPYTELGAGSKSPAKVLIAPQRAFAPVLDFLCKENTS